MHQIAEFKHTAKLPRLVSSSIIQRKELTLIAFWASLKTLYAAGAVNDYKKRYSELAEYTGLCERSVKDYIRKLIDGNLAVVTEDGVLRFKNKYVLVERYEIPVYGKYVKCNDYKFTKVKDLKNAIRAQAILDNQFEQKSVLDFKQKERFKKVAKAEAARQQKVQRLLNNSSFNGVHSEVKLSQKGIANIFGAKYKSTGKYWSDKLRDADLLKVEKQESVKKMENVSKSAFVQIRNANPEHSIYRTSNGNVYERQPNNIKVKIW